MTNLQRKESERPGQQADLEGAQGPATEEPGLRFSYGLTEHTE